MCILSEYCEVSLTVDATDSLFFLNPQTDIKCQEGSKVNLCIKTKTFIKKLRYSQSKLLIIAKYYFVEVVPNETQVTCNF